MRLLVVGPAGAAQRTDQGRGEPTGPDRHRPPPAPSRPRISETAWYSCVEETCTWVGRPMAPVATRAARAAWEGIIRYCSATCDQPGGAHRRPQRPQAVQVGRGRSLGQHRQPPVDRVGDLLPASPTGRRGQHEVGPELAQARLQRGEGRHVQRRGVRTTAPSSGPSSATGPRRGTSGPESRHPPTRTWSPPGPLRISRRHGAETMRSLFAAGYAPGRGSSGEGRHDLALRRPRTMAQAPHERRLIGGVDHLVHHDLAAVTVGMDPQVAGQRPPGHRNLPSSNPSSSRSVAAGSRTRSARGPRYPTPAWPRTGPRRW